MIESPPSRPRLLIFTLGPQGECRRRRFLPDTFIPLERSLHHHCLEAAVQAGAAVGCELFISSPAAADLDLPGRRLTQTESGFGPRLRAAIAAARAPEVPIILVGSDAPGLTATHLESTLASLAAAPSRVVIGPSPDGGFYLLAAKGPLDEILSRVRWQSRDTLATLLTALRAAGRDFVLLEPLPDLDARHDLEQWLADAEKLPASWSQLCSCLRRAMRSLRTFSFALPNPIPQFVPGRHGVVRGPPV